MYISEVVNVLHLSKKAIELYESKGFISPQKDASGYRVYGEVELERLRQVQILRSMEFSLAEINQIIVHKQYTLFDEKKAVLEKEEMRIKTIIQYLDKAKGNMYEYGALHEVQDDLQKTIDIIFDEELEQTAAKLESYPFKIIAYLCLFLLFVLLFLYNMQYISEDIFSILGFFCLSLFILFHVQPFQVFILRIHEKMHRRKSDR